MAVYFDKYKRNIRLHLKGSEFVHLLMIMRYNTRAFELNGHTAVELKGIVSDREIKRLINIDVD